MSTILSYPDTTEEELIAASLGEWVTAFIRGVPYQNIRGKHCLISLAAMPDYSNRGKFIAALEVIDEIALHLDAADGWGQPRYYFNLDRAKLEIEAWLQCREQL